MWLDLFASLVGEVVGVVLLTWFLIWLVLAAPRIIHREKLTGTGRAAWDVALPIGGLVAIVVVGQAILNWSIR